MGTREANTSIKLTKGHKMMMINEPNIYLLNYFFIALVLLVVIVDINNLFRNLLFGLDLCDFCFLILLHIHLLPPLLLCLPPPTSMAFQKPLTTPSPPSCTCCHTQRLISYPELTTYPNPPIYITPR